jgi:hypothetical protein
MKLWKLGARLGNWNDEHLGGHDRRVEASWRWRVVDRVASWLYLRGNHR